MKLKINYLCVPAVNEKAAVLKPRLQSGFFLCVYPFRSNSVSISTNICDNLKPVLHVCAQELQTSVAKKIPTIFCFLKTSRTFQIPVLIFSNNKVVLLNLISSSISEFPHLCLILCFSVDILLILTRSVHFQ